MSLIPKLLRFALLSINTFKIDESHGLSHSMKVLHYSHNILQSELNRNPYLENQRNIIYTSSILHDICDKKYMKQEDGLNYIVDFLRTNTSLTYNEIDVSAQIMNTMSYSTVKKYGFPDLGPYQLAYHIVREADLLAAYDFDRSIIYNMNRIDSSFINSLLNAQKLFDDRVFMHNDHDLFKTEYSKKMSRVLEEESYGRISNWIRMLMYM